MASPRASEASDKGAGVVPAARSNMPLHARTSGLLAMLAAANMAAWAWAWLTFHDRPALLGTALLAWVFGLRHAVDADHIAAIDNVVRKLMQEGQRPVAVGFFFSLGHSTIVVLASIVVAAASIHGGLEPMRAVGSVLGTGISAAFLLAIAAVNVMILKRIWHAFHDTRRTGLLDEAELNTLLAGRGFLARLFRPLLRSISRSWHVYPLGFLFGLGFDTATEIGLLGIAATQAAKGLSAWQTLVFAALFTAGMALVDTADSAVMVGAYGWAFVNPVRKLWYNLTITAASVLVAVLIGSLEALGLIADQLGLKGWFWSAIGNLNDDLANFGFVVVGIFVLCWIASAVVYRWRNYGATDIEIV